MHTHTTQNHLMVVKKKYMKIQTYKKTKFTCNFSQCMLHARRYLKKSAHTQNMGLREFIHNTPKTQRDRIKFLWYTLTMCCGVQFDSFSLWFPFHSLSLSTQLSRDFWLNFSLRMKTLFFFRHIFMNCEVHHSFGFTAVFSFYQNFVLNVSSVVYSIIPLPRVCL